MHDIRTSFCLFPFFPSIISSSDQLNDNGCFILSISLAMTVSRDISYFPLFFPRLVGLFFPSNYRSHCLENNVDSRYIRCVFRLF